MTIMESTTYVVGTGSPRGKSYWQLPVITGSVRPTHFLNESRGLEPTLTYGEEMAGSTQAQLLLSPRD